MKSTVVIAGSHTRTRAAIPWGQMDTDIWVFNESASLGWPEQVDGVFQMHHPAIWRNPLNRNDTNYAAWMQAEHPFPVWMIDTYADVPASVVYPLEDICAEFLPHVKRGETPVRYFTSSVAYAIALALHRGYRRIELYGVEMESDTEYRYQRDGVFFWLGLAAGRGVEVVVHPLSSFFGEPLYGYQGAASLQRSDFAAREALLAGLTATAHARLLAAEQAITVVLDEALTGGDGKTFFKALREHTQAHIDHAALTGALAEAQRYQAKADAMDAVGGVHIFSRQEFELTTANAKELQGQRLAQMQVKGGEAAAQWKQLEQAVAQKHSRKRLGRLAQTYYQAHEDYLKAAAEYGRLTGVLNENLVYIDQVDALIKAAGGERSEAVLLAAAERGADALV